MKLKKAVRLIIITGGTLVLMYTILMSIVSNFHLGLAALAVLSVAFIIYGILMKRLEKAVWLHALVAFGCTVLLLFSGFLAFYGSDDTAMYDEDALIVLGAGIRGERMTQSLSRRLDKASQYFERNNGAVIVVSGGQGPQETITEALAMERYLLAKGIPAEKIIKEERATSTQENFKFSKMILDEIFPGGYKTAFVTNGYHVYRAGLIAKAEGFDIKHLGTKIALYTVPMNYMREMMAVIQQWFLK